MLTVGNRRCGCGRKIADSNRTGVCRECQHHGCPPDPLEQARCWRPAVPFQVRVERQVSRWWHGGGW